MKCADPKLVYVNPYTGKRVFRDFSLSSDLFKQIHSQKFDCGKCLSCRKKRAYELAARCCLHSAMYPRNSFITLTYNEQLPGYHNTLEYLDIQKFKKRLRSHVFRKFNKKIEIFNVHEYGKNGKKHWHLIIFNHDFSEEKDKKGNSTRFIHTIKNGIPLYTSKTLEKLWPFGFSTIGDVSEASAMYQAQYMEKDFKNNNAGTNKKSVSRHSGIGRAYFLAHYRQILTLGYIPFSGRKLPIPRYFQKLAHKHWCHFNDQTAFFNTKERKALYRPFKNEEPNELISILYEKYKNNKNEKLEEIKKDWEDYIQQHIKTKDKPDFVLSNDNALYDLKNKTQKERF